MLTRLLTVALPGLLVVAGIGHVLASPSGGPVILTRHDLAGHVTCVGCADLDPAHPFHATVAAAIEGKAEPTAAPAGSIMPWMPGRCEQFAALFRDSGERHGVDPALLAIVAIVESGCQVAPLGPATAIDTGRGQTCRGNSSTAYGLMQVTTRWHGTASNWCDPVVAVPYAARKLATDARNNGGDFQRAVYMFNSGYLRTAEGDRYTRWVWGMFGEKDAPSSAYFEDWCGVRPGGTFGLNCS